MLHYFFLKKHSICFMNPCNSIVLLFMKIVLFMKIAFLNLRINFQNYGIRNRCMINPNTVTCVHYKASIVIDVLSDL